MITKLEFLKLVEGNEYHAYVPATGRSGVTIGIGVDLGNIGVKNLDVSEDLLEKLLPYDGLHGRAAISALNTTPLRLSQEETNLLSLSAIELHEKELEVQFNRGSDVPYNELHPYKKIVLLSVKYQYGNLPKRTPKFWGYSVSGEWKAAYQELRNFGDDYPTRRNKEADLLQQALNDERNEECSENYLHRLMNLERKHRKLVGRLAGPRCRDKTK